MTVWTTRWLKFQRTLSPTLIVICRRKKPLRSRSVGNFADPARLAVGGGPPATTVFVFAPAVAAVHKAPSVAIASTVTHRRIDILTPPPGLGRP